MLKNMKLDKQRELASIREALKTLKMPSQQETIKEALDILTGEMAPEKLAVFVSMLPIGEENYLAVRSKLFPEEKLLPLVEKIKERHKQ